MSAPVSRFRRSKKTPSVPCQSTWPAMIAGPTSPGAGAPVYHPASFPSGGTSSAPSVSSPRSMMSVSTPMDGISRRVGRWSAVTGALSGSAESVARGADVVSCRGDECGCEFPLSDCPPAHPTTVTSTETVRARAVMARRVRGAITEFSSFIYRLVRRMTRADIATTLKKPTSRAIHPPLDCPPRWDCVLPSPVSTDPRGTCCT